MSNENQLLIALTVIVCPIPTLLLGLSIFLTARNKDREDKRLALHKKARIRAETGKNQISELTLSSRAEPKPRKTEQLTTQLARIKACLDVGSDVTAYRAELANLIAISADRQNQAVPDPPAFAKLVELAVVYHRDALQLWDQVQNALASHTTGNWSGGGFGLEGALKGVLAASILNALQSNTEEVRELVNHLAVERQVSLELALACQAAVVDVAIRTTS